MKKKIEIENHAGKVRKCLFCEQYHWHSTKKFRQKIYTVLLFSMNEWIHKNRQEYKIDRFYIYMTQYHLKGKTKCEWGGEPCWNYRYMTGMKKWIAVFCGSVTCKEPWTRRIFYGLPYETYKEISADHLSASLIDLNQ